MPERVFAPGEVDPLDPNVKERMKVQQIESQHAGKSLSSVSDLTEKSLQVGCFVARPLSAAVLAILEGMDHPVMAEHTKGEMRMQDILVILYLLCCEDEREMVTASIQGEVREAALVWGFGVTPDMIQAAIPDLERLMNEMGTAAEDYGVGDDDPEKKAVTGS